MERIQIGKLVGMSSPERWSQVHAFVPEAGHKKDKGILLVVVSVGRPASSGQLADTRGMDLAAFGQEMIQRAHEEFYGNQEVVVEEESVDKIGILEGIKRVIDKVVGEFKQVDVAMAVGVMVEKDERRLFYGGVWGEGRVELVREGEVFGVIRGERGRLVRASGWVREGDVLVLGTGELFELVGSERWREVEVGKAEEMVEQLAPLLAKGEAVESGLTAAAAGLVVAINTQLEQVEKPGEGREVEEAGKERLIQRIKMGMGRLKESLGLRREWQPRQREIGSQEVYVGPRDKKKWMRMSVAAILVILLGVSIVLGWRKQQQDRGARSLAAVQQSVKDKFEQAKSLAELNKLRARTVLDEARTEVDDYKKSKKLNKKDQVWVAEVSREIEKQLKVVSRIYDVAEAGIFLDLSLVREGSRGEVMDLADENVVVLDRENGVVLKVGLNKSAGLVGGGELVKGSKLLTVMGKKGFVWGDKGIVEVSLEKKTSQVVAKADEKWGEVVDMKGFGGSVYLLDKKNNQVWKHGGTDVGLGEASAWFKPRVEPDLSQAVALAIDGSVWILTRTGKVVKYTRGSPDALEISGLDVPLDGPTSIYTDAESEGVYILDQGNKRVVVINKSGEYQAQYRWEGLGRVSDMVVSEKEKKILLLEGSMIYEMGL